MIIDNFLELFAISQLSIVHLGLFLKN